jgi:hypothetical protein
MKESTISPRTEMPGRWFGPNIHDVDFLLTTVQAAAAAGY